jgi:hypothetical protein
MIEPEKHNPEIEERLARLEHTVETTTAGPAPAVQHPAWPLVLGLAALVLGYLGLGLPQHYYQPLFAGLFLLLAYHRGFIHFYPQPWRWALVVLNFLLLLMMFKLLLGGGLSYPFDWLKVPTLQSVPPADGSWTQKYLPNYQLVWEGVPGISDWYVNISKFQSMLLIATLIGALFRFQPFASLTALALLVISFPSYLVFNWDYVVLFLVIGGAAIYLQSGPQRS